MRKLVLLVWLMLPVLVGAYHFGPGQQRMLLDDVSTVLAQADERVAAEDWPSAVKKYEEALALLPAERVHEAQRIRLERAKAQMFDKKLPTAHQDLTSLVDELKQSENVDEQLLFEARSALSNSQYYMTWLMRLEGQPRERWEREIEASRQTYRLLAEQSERSGDAEGAKKSREDLESAIRLARMDLGELQGLPLPSQ
ncbi:MAG: hypothetical protein HON53_04975 [Planctomycetaceae bacterium]|jgi:hypothetical protein|nr:hypothetical protein [Planctomycetaceae bacterium]MBT6158119.1 hypothetical protein [Planctomycetaceae bacterium]MBT6483850.1 hypothetical protein [Planctomycetaceae bacterium]MBT6497689.1 hypothetical protein [Planctomycetaceae bacterium]